MIFQDCTQLISAAKYLIASFPVLLMHCIDQMILMKHFLMCCFASYFQAFLIGLVVSCCRGKKSVIEGEVEADDSDLSDDEYVH